MYRLHHWTPSGKNVKDALKSTLEELNCKYLVDRDVMDDESKIKLLENISDISYLLCTIQKEERTN